MQYVTKSIRSDRFLVPVVKYHRWRIVIFGGINSHSRVITYLSCYNNNRAHTELSEFLRGVESFGLPSRVQTDQGGENVEIAWYMFSHTEREDGRGSQLTGKGVLPTITERCMLCCTFKYYLVILIYGGECCQWWYSPFLSTVITFSFLAYNDIKWLFKWMEQSLSLHWKISNTNAALDPSNVCTNKQQSQSSRTISTLFCLAKA